MIDPRRLGIGGSEIAALFGCDEYKDAFSVWASKKGGLAPAPPTLRMRVGKALEPAIIGLYGEIIGREVEYHDRTLSDPARPFMVYTPDALVVGEPRGVDAKVVAWDQRRHWGETADDIPRRVLMQCWWYCAGLDYEMWDVAALVAGDLRIYHVERDRQAEEVMLARAAEFYERYLIGNEVPPITGSAAAREWLKQAFANHKTPDILPAGLEQTGLLDSYAETRLQLKELEKQRATLENRIIQQIGEHEGIQSESARFTWRKTKDREQVDYKSMAIGIAHHYIEDPAARQDVLNSYTEIKPGYRRIYFDSDLFHEEKEA